MQRVSATSKRIDVVFDVYREKSFKNTQREKRGDTRESSTEIYSQMTEYNNGGTLRIRSSWLELSEWQKERLRHRLTCRHLFTTTEESCVEISADNFRPREDLTSTQEEVDTRRLLHASHAANNGSKAMLYHQKIPMYLNFAWHLGKVHLI